MPVLLVSTSAFNTAKHRLLAIDSVVVEDEEDDDDKDDDFLPLALSGTSD